MDIYKLSEEIINDYKEQSDLANEKYHYYHEQFYKINFNEPLFKGYDISVSCNPVSCRLIIFFTDTLIPYFIKNIISKDAAQINKVILNFTAIFNFIFFLIFDEYEYNEKKWIVQQINTLLKGLNPSDIDYFKLNICISFEEQPHVKKNEKCNFIMELIKEEDELLLKELGKVLRRCLPFWSIAHDDHELTEGNQYYSSTFYKSDTKINFLPINVDPNKNMFIPIKKDIGILIFNNFSDPKNTLKTVMLKKKPSEVNAQLKTLFSEIKNIEGYTTAQLAHIKPNETPHNIQLINKFMICFYIFIILQSCGIFPKNKKYPETYDEIFTMFSNININTISTYKDFFLPVNNIDTTNLQIQDDQKIGISEERKPMNSNVGTPPFPATIRDADDNYKYEPDNTLPANWLKYKSGTGKEYYVKKDGSMSQWQRPTANDPVLSGGRTVSRSTKKTSIKKRILKKPKKTIRNTK